MLFNGNCKRCSGTELPEKCTICCYVELHWENWRRMTKILALPTIQGLGVPGNAANRQENSSTRKKEPIATYLAGGEARRLAGPDVRRPGPAVPLQQLSGGSAGARARLLSSLPAPPARSGRSQHPQHTRHESEGPW